MLLAELEVFHSRPIAPTRRVAVGVAVLPTAPAPGFGGLLLSEITGRELEGRVTLEPSPAGLKARIEAAAEALEARGVRVGPQELAAPSGHRFGRDWHHKSPFFSMVC